MLLAGMESSTFCCTIQAVVQRIQVIVNVWLCLGLFLATRPESSADNPMFDEKPYINCFYYFVYYFRTKC